MTEPRPTATPAGQHLHEEEALGKVYDADLLRRLWPFMRPYRGQVWFSIALIPLRAALEVMPPLIIGAALDYLTRGEVTSSIPWLTPILQPPASPSPSWRGSSACCWWWRRACSVSSGCAAGR